MKVIPAIDLIAGKTVRLKQGRYDCELKYQISPIEAAERWESMGARLLHVVDLDGARLGVPGNLPTIKQIVRAVSIPVQTGGGYRSETDIETALDAGVSRVIIGSKAFQDPGFAEKCIGKYGRNVILSADAKDLKPMIRGWEEGIGGDFFDLLRQFVSFGMDEIIYTDIKRDGMLTGPGIDNIKKILSEVKIKLISAGGVKTVEHIRELKRLEHMGVTGVIVGRALYEGTIDLEEAINAGKEDNPLS
ncbi:MAG: 1-(5-phosphoribosyl)-5-[(5-phosphoribosylamino)methylideneamino]imidazole-4-carboxamide isomerase [Candidatus Omnitrophota bacterium]